MKKTSGFTLIELMVVIAIIAILAAIAFPSYRQYVQKGKLAEIKSSLMAYGVRLEKSNIAKSEYPATDTFSASNIENSDKYTYTYARGTTDTQAYVLKGEQTNFKIWASINSKGVRCACRECGPSSNITFIQTTDSCPSGTDSF